jgi:hypothetical protein
MGAIIYGSLKNKNRGIMGIKTTHVAHIITFPSILTLNIDGVTFFTEDGSSTYQNAIFLSLMA